MKGISFTLLLLLSILVLIISLWIGKEFQRIDHLKKIRLLMKWSVAFLNVITLGILWHYFFDPQKIRLAVDYLPYYRITGWAVLIYVPQLVFLIFSIFDLFAKYRKSRSFQFRIVGGIYALVVFIYLLYGWQVDPFQLRVIKLPVKADIPIEFDGYRVVQVSDIHMAFFKNHPEMITQIVEIVNQLHPDLVCYTGDQYNNYAEEMIPFVPILSQVIARDGCFFHFRQS